jgi:hypothetical protein
MNKEQDFEVVELGVASEETRGAGVRGLEPIGHPFDAGISDAD